MKAKLGGQEKGPQAMAGDYNPDIDPPPKRKRFSPWGCIYTQKRYGLDACREKITSGKFENALSCASNASQQLDVEFPGTAKSTSSRYTSDAGRMNSFICVDSARLSGSKR
jgi:hypothetical protein